MALCWHQGAPWSYSTGVAQVQTESDPWRLFPAYGAGTM